MKVMRGDFIKIEFNRSGKHSVHPPAPLNLGWGKGGLSDFGKLPNGGRGGGKIKILGGYFFSNLRN